MTLDHTTSTRQALAEWDRGEPIQSIEMGGIGPAYEQAIQILTWELVRVWLDALSTGRQAAGEALDDEIARPVISRLDRKLGFSVAQVAVAKNLAANFVTQGHAACCNRYRDRCIMVVKNFPVYP